MAQFKDMLKYLSKTRNLSQDELSKLIGVSTSTIGMYESGRRHPNVETEEKIADLFNVSLDTLRGQDTESRNGKHHCIRIPLLGNVAAGKPIDAIEDIIDYEYISEGKTKGKELFALRIKGDSMEPLICEHDIVIVQKQNNAKNGDIVIASIDNETAVCKKYVVRKGALLLTSLNQKYEPLSFNSKTKTKVSIIGKIIELRRKV